MGFLNSRGRCPPTHPSCIDKVKLGLLQLYVQRLHAQQDTMPVVKFHDEPWKNPNPGRVHLKRLAWVHYGHVDLEKVHPQ